MNSSDNRVYAETRSWLELRVCLVTPDIWWGSLWAALCGAVASGAFRLDGNSLVRLAVVLLLADPLLSNLSRLVLGLDWPEPPAPAPAPGDAPAYIFPYVEQDSPGYRLGEWLVGTALWWKKTFWPQTGWMVSGVIFGAFGIVVAGAILGPPVLWLAVGEIGLIALGALARAYWPDSVVLVRALAEAGIVWLVGFLAFAPWSVAALVLAGMYALLFGVGVLILRKGVNRLMWIVPVTLVGFLGMALALRVPVIAGLLGIASVFPVWISFYAKNIPSCSRWYLRKTRFSMLAVTFLAALAMGLS